MRCFGYLFMIGILCIWIILEWFGFWCSGGGGRCCFSVFMWVGFSSCDVILCI